MKTIFNIFTVMTCMRVSKSSVYDWQVRTIEQNSAFGDDLKVQTALNNERQQDLLKISGKINNIHYYPDFDYNPFNQKMDSKINSDSNSKHNHGEYGEDNDSGYKSNRAQLNNKTEQNNEQHLLHRNQHTKFNQNIQSKNHLNRDNSQARVDVNNKTIEVETKVSDSSVNQVDTESFMGTNLFYNTAKKCFSSDDVTLLAIRKDLERLLPKNLPECLFDDRIVALLLNYFYISHQMILQAFSDSSSHMAQMAYYDTIGGYLNYYMIPVAKYSYYAGQISLATAQSVLSLYQESRKFLNTNGNGWKSPLENIPEKFKSVQIKPLHISELDESTRDEQSCMQLKMNANDNQPDNDKIIVQLPQLDDEKESGYLGNIWLPFKRKNTYDLKSQSSNYIVVKFYETVTKCYRFENIDQELYNQKFKTWLVESINIHLSDAEFYPGLGAVLRIYEYLKVGKKNIIGIGHELRSMTSVEERNRTNRNPQNISGQLSNNRSDIHNKTKEYNYSLKNAERDDLKTNNRNASTEDLSEKVSTLRNKLEVTVHLLRTLDLGTPQIIIITIPVLAILLILFICCYKCFCKKKKPEPVIKLQKNSSSSSSNLFNSPVRFFHIRKKSPKYGALDDSSTEAGSKKGKKAVKIEKKALISSDLSAPNSPVRKKKSNDKGKNQESAKK